MNRSLAVIQEHRKHLLARLTSGSPLLRFRPTAYREDILELFRGILPNPPVDPESANSQRTVPVTTPLQLLENLLAAEPHAVEIRGAAKQILAKCRKIYDQGDDWYHSTGQHSLYIGFPLVFVPLEAEKFLLAPLYLWNIEMAIRYGNRIRVSRLTDDEGPLDPVPNRLFQIWLQQELSVNLSTPGKEISIEVLSDVVRSTLRQWRECKKGFNKVNVQPVPARAAMQEWVKRGEGPTVLSSAVIGHCPFKGQALLDDLDQIEKRMRDGADDIGALDAFVRERAKDDDERASRIPDIQQWHVARTDPSQEQIIWQGRHSRVMVLHGPPGTGKSQTIVNLVSDALKSGKKVAVICQKEAALEVVRKRLEASGLTELVLHIKELARDRWSTVTRIREIQDDLYVGQHVPSERRALCKRLEEYDDVLENSKLALGTVGASDTRFGDIQAKLTSLGAADIVNRPEFTALKRTVSENLPENNDELRELLGRVDTLIQDAANCQYFDNPWRDLTRCGSLSVGEIDDLRSSLRTMVAKLESCLADANVLPYSSQLTWVVEHNWAQGAHASFLPPTSRPSYYSLLDVARVKNQLVDWLPAQSLSKFLPAHSNISTARATVNQHLQHCGWIRDISDLKQRLNTDPVLSHLVKELCSDPNLWLRGTEIAVLRCWRDKHEWQYQPPRPRQVERAIEQIEKDVHRKRQLDSEDIKNDFMSRLDPKNRLVDGNLTRLRRSSQVRSTSLRALYSDGFEHVHKLFPVLLTNPETACAMLPLTPSLYDLVILDEASQIFMSDALPILYRAKNVVVSGDQKQMPPSDFFVVSEDKASALDDSEEEDEEEVVVKEASSSRLIAAEGEYCLLDAAVFAVREGSPANRRLRVHYRSDFPELIAYSNHAFYDGELIAPKGNQIPLECCSTPIVLKLIDGQFSRGENEAEATAVVEAVEKVLSDQNPPTLGVVAFNIRQRDLINELIAERAEGNAVFGTNLEKMRQRKNAEGEDESFFVRSVEHVQGDERDLIIFSTTYDGRRSHNFGPISRRNKGRRRLNVAITRAKRGLIILTSLDIDGLATERDKSEAYFFWKYLCYARAVSQENLQEAQAILVSMNDRRRTSTRAYAESPFEEDVAQFLRMSGFHVDFQVGESGFRIDLGVKRQQSDHRYICGIECDGRLYHSDWTARMNDEWRAGVLRDKGWSIIRVWSTEWYDTPENARKTLLTKIQTECQASRFR